MRPDHVVQRLHERQIDVGFVYLPLEDPSLNIECITREPLVLALPEAHPLTSEDQVELRALRRNRLFSPHAIRGCRDCTGGSPKLAARRDLLQMRCKRTSGSCRPLSA
jgi:DNA-binding transcriptional LysR family regulator